MENHAQVHDSQIPENQNQTILKAAREKLYI